ncbi:MAG TPA: hypothetical protein VLN49_15120 [Gemmatimonadaceae bacterium]|nr:hypothetical protein [Gemmatimonadaceae bacterium]
MRAPLPLLAVLLLLAACESPLVDWSDPRAITPMAGPSRLVVDTEGSARFVADTAAGIALPEPTPGSCERSLRRAAATVHAYAIWWSARADSSAVLYVARSADAGRSWAKPIAIDTADMSTNGCDRPPPSLTTVGDDVYVAYSMIAPDGRGVFFAHMMSGMLHSPVPVVYGERLVNTAIAAQDPRVAVAYEDPNGSRHQIGVALSTTQGHLFDWRTTASRVIDDATSPAVALAGRMLAVSWAAGRGEQHDSTNRRVVRVGRIQ